MQASLTHQFPTPADIRLLARLSDDLETKFFGSNHSATVLQDLLRLSCHKTIKAVALRTPSAAKTACAPIPAMSAANTGGASALIRFIGRAMVAIAAA